MSNKFIIVVFFFLFSCNYPDIDSLPDFGSFNISIQESIDLCKIRNSDKENNEDCFKDLKNIISGL